MLARLKVSSARKAYDAPPSWCCCPRPAPFAHITATGIILVLAILQAELRANVFLAVDEQDKRQGDAGGLRWRMCLLLGLHEPSRATGPSVTVWA